MHYTKISLSQQSRYQENIDSFFQSLQQTHQTDVTEVLLRCLYLVAFEIFYLLLQCMQYALVIGRFRVQYDQYFPSFLSFAVKP